MYLSVIIPVYNVEKYLEECVSSLYSQGISLSDFEVLLINDGSTDDSLQIIKNLYERYENIRFFTQENRGLSETRNRGIFEAKGEYIFFLDSDDFVYPNLLYDLLNIAIEKKLDVLRFDYWNVSECGDRLSLSHYIERRKKYANQVGNGDFLLKRIYNREFYACFSLLKRDFLLKYQIRFTPGIYYEDIEFSLNLALYAERIMYVPQAVYAYRNRSTSIVNTFNRKKAEDLIEILARLRNSAFSKIEDIEYVHVVEENITSLMVFLLLRVSEFPLFRERYYLLNLIREKGLLYIYPQKTIKEKLIPVLYNKLGGRIVFLLFPFTLIKRMYSQKWTL